MCTRKIAGLGLVDPQLRNFSVLFTGYERADKVAITRFAMVSNYRKLSEFSGVDRWPEPFDTFKVSYQQTSPTKYSLVLSAAVNSWRMGGWSRSCRNDS